jgi:hypothetical protein
MDDTRSDDSALRESEALKAADRVLGETGAKKYLRLAGRIIGCLIGALLLVTGLSKATMPQDFGHQIADYDIVTNPILVGLISYTVILVECALGAALLVRLRPRLTIALAGLLMVGFLVAVGYAWKAGTTEDCGCLPWVTRTPGEAFVEDLILLALLGWAWWAQRGAPAPARSWKTLAVGAAVALAMVVVGVFGVAGLGSPGAGGEAGATTFKTLRAEDLPADLSTGDHLVLLMSTECTHCKDAVPEINALFNDSRLPPLVAVASQDRVSRGLFRQDYGAQYPIGQIPESAVRPLIKAGFPKLFLVRDGTILESWEGTMPQADDIVAAVAKR